MEIKIKKLQHTKSLSLSFIHLIAFHTLTTCILIKIYSVHFYKFLFHFCNYVKSQQIFAEQECELKVMKYISSSPVTITELQGEGRVRVKEKRKKEGHSIKWRRSNEKSSPLLPRCWLTILAEVELVQCTCRLCYKSNNIINSKVNYW